MRHVPFLKVLAKAKDSADPVWRDAAPGYLVLRVLDRWLEEGPAAIAADPALPALRARIRSGGAVDPEVRRLLLQALDALVSAVELDPRPAIEHLLEYGEYLRAHGLVPLAAHTYDMLVECLDTLGFVNDPQLIVAVLRQALIARVSGKFDIARAAYYRAESLARQQGELEQVGLARLGVANLTRIQGNLPGSEQLYSEIIAEAQTLGLTMVEARGYYGRAGVSHQRGRYVEAMKDYYRAYEHLTGVDRERILGDLATCEADAGYRDAARDTNRLLAYTAQFDVVRATAIINLIELAALDGDEAAFDRARLDLTAHEQRHTLLIDQQVYAAFYLAMGAERFSSFDNACEAYRAVIAKARSAGVHQIEFEAERKLEELVARQSRPHPVPQPAAVATPPAELRYITDTIAAAASSALATLQF